MTGPSVRTETLWDHATPETVRDALTSRAVRDRLRQALTSMLISDAELEPCRIRRAKFKPGRKLTVHIDVRARSGTDDVTRQVVVRLLPGAHLPEGSIADEAGSVAAPGATITRPFERLHGHVPDLRAEILVWPFDPQLPRLHQLADPTHAGRMLTPEGHGDRTLAFGVRTIRYRPGERHVIRYVPLDPAAECIGTVYAKLGRNGDPARMGAITTRAAEVLEASDLATTAARPVRGAADTNVLLLAGVGGRPLSEMLRRVDPAALPHVLRVGRALGALHAGSSADDGRSQARPEPRTNAARRASEHITSMLPDVGAQVVETLDRAEAAFEAVDVGEPTLVHGDLKADHVLIGGGRTSFVDFGSLGTGEPSMDLGKFLADLRWWQPPRTLPGRRACAAFLRGYGRGDDDARVLRARVWESVYFLGIAAHRVPLWDVAWEQRTRSLIDEADRALHETEAHL